ncbi:MAG: hypothetical protein IJR89_04430 [Clostridia bacterium]|nr:hypothetical protein [Clostridia bacterium]
MKKAGTVFFVVLLFFLSAGFARAQEYEYRYSPEEEGENDRITEYASAFRETLPEELSEESRELAEAALEGKSELSFSLLLRKSFFAITREATAPLRLLSLLLALLIVLSLFRSLGKSAEGNAGVAASFRLCSVLALSSCVLGTARHTVAAVRDILSSFNSFLFAMFPVLTSLYASGGKVGEAVAAHSALYLLTSFISDFCVRFILPAGGILTALALAGAVLPFDLSGFSRWIKRLFSLSLALASAALSAVLAFQTHISAARDGLALRAVRFAAGSFIPVVGASLGEAFRTVAGSLSFLKTTIGWASVAVVLGLLLPVLLSLLLFRFSLGAASACAKAIGCQKESGLMEEISDVFGLYAGVVTAAGSVFIVAITLLVQSGGGE